MVGAGIFALLGEAGTVAGVRRLALVPARRHRLRAARLHRRQARRPLPVLGRAHRLPDPGLRERPPRRHRLLARLLRRDRDRLLDGGRLVRRATPRRSSSATTPRRGWDNVFTSADRARDGRVNIVGSRLVDRAQSLIVVVLLAVFAVFIVVTLADIDLDLLAFSGYPPFSDIVASVALTFFAYLGFSVITFAAGDLRDPARELPKAMYRALGVTTVLYVLIAIGVFGTLTVPEVVGYGETAIAEAARPALGDAGFTMMAIAALLATVVVRQRDALRVRRPDRDARGASASSRRSSGRGSRLGAHGGHADHGRDRARRRATSSTSRRSRPSGAPARS